MRVVIDDRTYDYVEIGLDKYDFLLKLEEMKPAQVISFLTDAPLEEIKKAPFADVKFVSQMVKSQFYQTYNNTPLELTYTHNGVHYGLIIPSKISFEEWVNLEVMMASAPLDYALVAAHLYKPLRSDKQGDERELWDYSLDECQRRAQNEFKDFPVRIFNSALFFFTTFVMEYTQNILSSMETSKTEKTLPTDPKNQERANNHQ
jgi:hypothetical protein